jgi:hypothetical protein
LRDNENIFVIAGKSIPYGWDDFATELVEFSINNPRLRIALKSQNEGHYICDIAIWEHTVHELEVLIAALRNVAVRPFPPKIEVETLESRIGTTVTFSSSITAEVGYSYQSPQADRVKFFCSSRVWDLRNQRLGVGVGVALSGCYAEIVAEPEHILNFVLWLERKVDRLQQLLDGQEGQGSH